MDPLIGSALVSAGSSIVGGLFGDSAKDKDRKMQKEFAQNGIRWKVADAEAAGLHPLAALGAQVSSYSPVSVGDTGLGAGISSAGQDISRAINATRTQGERESAYTKTVQDLSVQKMGLENQILASQLRKINQAGIPPAMPSAADRHLIEGQGNSPLVNREPMKATVADPGALHSEPGSVVDLGWARTSTGWAPVPSADVKSRIEDMAIPEIMWGIRNNLAPNFGGGTPPNIPLAKDEFMRFNPLRQEWQIVKRGPRSIWKTWGGRYNY